MSKTKILMDRATMAGHELDQLLSVQPAPGSKMLTAETLRQGKAVAFQRIVKMGVLASGEFGKGFVLAKVPASNGLGWQWSAPAFYSLMGGSLGLTTAVESIHTIIVLSSVEAGAKLASGGSYMGPDFDLTFANDYSATKTTQEGMLTRSEVLSATKSSGGFAIDASFSGGSVSSDQKTNASCYGQGVTPQQILSGEVEPPPEMNTLYQKLYSRMAVDPTSAHEAEARTATHIWNAAP